MDFVLVCIGMLAALGVVAAVATWLSGGTDDPVVVAEHDCASCASADDGSCKLACLLEEKKRREGNKQEQDSV
jgi:hypothetical protein